MNVGARSRRWFQFSIRALLTLVLLASVPLAWLGMRLDGARRQRAAMAAIEGVSGRAIRDYEAVPAFDARGLPVKIVKPSDWRYLRKWLGDDLFDPVVALDLSRAHDLDRCLPKLEQQLKNLPHLTTIDAHDRLMGDVGLEVLLRLPHLESLNVSGTQVTGKGLIRLGEISRLRELELPDVREDVDPRWLTSLGRLTELRRLRLPWWLPSRKLAAPLAKLRKLRELSIGYLNEDTLQVFRGLPDLESLALRIDVLDAGAETLCSLPRLRSLMLVCSTLRPNALQALGRLARLETLELHGPRTAIDDWQWLAGLRELRHLAWHNTTLDDEALDQLARLDQLETIYLNVSGLRDAGIARLKAALPKCAISYRPIFNP